MLEDSWQRFYPCSEAAYITSALTPVGWSECQRHSMRRKHMRFGRSHFQFIDRRESIGVKEIRYYWVK